MATAAQAFKALQTRVESGGLPIPLRWQNKDDDSDGLVPLPDIPAPFIYGDFVSDTVEIVSFGGGRFRNTYRNQCVLYLWVFVPRGWGIDPALDYAEQAAALLRSYRTSEVSCFAARVVPGGDGAAIQPPGLRSEVNAYYYAYAEVEFMFDQIG